MQRSAYSIARAIRRAQRIVGRQPHGAVDLRNGLSALADPGMSIGIPKPGAGAVRIDLQRIVEAVERQSEVLLKIGGDVALNRKSHRVRAIAIDRPLGITNRLDCIGSRIGRPSLTDPQHVPIGAPGQGGGILRLTAECQIEQLLRGLEHRP